MKYRELLELYKKEELNEEQMQQVENDIEKHEAISEYLFDREEEDELKMDVLNETNESSKKIVENKEADEFTKLVNRKIRKAFIKFGVIVSAFTVVIVLVAVSVFPKIADKAYSEYSESESAKYYNPGEMIGEQTNQMSLDLQVYAEALLPLVLRQTVDIEDKGFGNYDIYIPQNLSYTGKFYNAAGEINQGKLVLYDPNAFRKPSSNVFAWFQIKGNCLDTLSELIDESGQMNTSASGSRESAMNRLYELKEDTKYKAYVTLDKMLPYEEFMEFQESTDVGAMWCAVCTINGISNEWRANKKDTFIVDNIGFRCSLGAASLAEYDLEKYPELIAWRDSVEPIEKVVENFGSEAYMKQHFVSMMNYLADQEEFLEMMGENKNTFEMAAEYVEENGLRVYGYVTMGEKEDLIQLAEENPEVIYQIYPEEMQ